MRTGSRSLTTLVSLRGFGAFGWTVVPVIFLSGIACSSTGDSSPAEGDGGAQDGATDAGNASADGAADASDPSLNSDPQDLAAANGDPSLDIAGSWIFFDNDQPWVRAKFYGEWPPAGTLYSWSCSVLLGMANAPVVTYTVTALNGTQSNYADGMDKAKVTFVAEPTGFRVLFAETTLQFDRYGLQCTVQKAKTGPLEQDDSGSFIFKTKESRTFGP